MSFTYQAGSSTPNRAGLIEVGSIRISGAGGGTFELLGAPGLLWGSPGVRPGFHELSNDHGAYAGQPFYGEREFQINGRLRVPAVDDMWGAIDLLFETFNLASSALKTHTLDTLGWSASRQIAARLAGEIQIQEPEDDNGHFALRRGFTVPMVAPDPRIYSSTLHSTTVTSGGTSLANAGNMPTPFTVTFNGPQTGPLVLTDPDGNTITVSASPTSGHYVEVTTRGSSSGATAVDDLGASKFSSVTDWSATVVAAGSDTWTATNGGGAGTTVVSHRDAWS